MFHSNTILPTINYKTPKPSLLGILEGRIKIVVDKIPHQKGNAFTGKIDFNSNGGYVIMIISSSCTYTKNKTKLWQEVLTWIEHDDVPANYVGLIYV